MAVSVLIVEDDRNIAELLQMYLEKEGYAVTVAADGGQGLAKFRAIKPDLVLLDVMMPVMDGWAVCRDTPHSRPISCWFTFNAARRSFRRFPSVIVHLHVTYFIVFVTIIIVSLHYIIVI